MTSSPHTDEIAESAATARSLLLLLIVLCAALALVVAGNSALAIALPDIAADLSAALWVGAGVLSAAAALGAALAPDAQQRVGTGQEHP